MLQIKELTITYKKDLRTLISGLSFVLNPGDKAAIIGEEGNGKSTLMKLLYDERLVEDYAEYSGEILRNNSVLGYLQQELDQPEKEMSIYEFMIQEAGFYEMEGKELAGMANRVGLPPDLLYSCQKVDTLSGGEKVKLQMIRLLCKRPDTLLLDEPSNDIDLETLEWLEQFVLQWEGAVLFISHDETLLERTANRIFHLELLKKKKEAKHTICNTGYGEYVTSREQQLAKQEQLAKNERSEYKAQQERIRRIEQKVAHQQNTISRQDPHGAALLKKKMRAVRSMAHRFEKEAAEMTEIPDTEEAIFLKFHGSEKIPNGKNILQLTQKELRAGDEILAENIELLVNGREKICLIGKNGVGKTTLLKIIAEKLLERDDIHAAYMPQDYRDRMNFDSTPSAFLSQTGDKEELTRIHTFLGSLKFTAEEMNRPIRELSGGQKAKLFLLHLSMNGANVLILDEPTRNLSPLSNPVIRQLLKDFDGAIISVSHDRKYIAEVCDTVYELTRDGCRLLTANLR
jgi:ATPase subunit of ABC transporter with duplicated ATPase domains